MHVHSKLIGAVLLVAALAIQAPTALAQPGHEHADGEGHATAEAQSYSDAVHAIGERLEAIEGALASKQLDSIHEDSEVIMTIAANIGRLALAKDSGVARKAIRDVNVAGRALTSASDRLHEVADEGQFEDSLSEFKQMMEIFEILQSNLPGLYTCPMHHENAQTFSAPGDCPVCGMPLKKLADPTFSVEVTPAAGMLLPRTETPLQITITNPAGGPIHELQVVHEKELHLFLVSKDLSWFAHEHPAQQGDGVFMLPVTFPHAGEFVLFHSFTPEGAEAQVVPVTLQVEGTPPPAAHLAQSHDLETVVDGYTVRLDASGGLSAGHEAVLAFDISRDGQSVTNIEPYLGAMGHMVIISDDLKQFVHSHPQGASHDEDSSHHDSGDADHHDEHGGMDSGANSSIVRFHAEFPADGLYKSWVQFQHRGRVITAPFAIRVGGDGDHHAESEPHDH